MQQPDDVVHVEYKIRANRRIKGYTAELTIHHANGDLSKAYKDYPSGQYGAVIANIKSLKAEMIANKMKPEQITAAPDTLSVS